ncbi:glycosyltransferase family 4 protein [Candidatus Omnitrophota bacterium]
MRIGIDIRDLAFPIVGVGNATLQLLDYIDRQNEHEKCILYQYSTNQYCKSNSSIRKVAPISPYSYLREQIYFSARTVLDKLNIFHAPIHLPPFHFSKKTKIVFTVHDLHSELDQTYFPPDMNKYFQGRRQRAIQIADAVIVHSKFVQEKVCEIGKVNANKVHVVPLSIPATFKRVINEESIETIKRKYSLPDRYVLFVGSIEPWKNVQMLIKAFLSYKSKTNDDIHLIIAGRDGWNKEVCSFMKHSVDASPFVRWLDYVPSHDLPEIYKCATLFASASLWEGFGIVFLEAMEYGIPIIAANHAAIPEVVGNAGVLFDILLPEDLEEKLSYVLKNNSVLERLSQAGKKRFASFEKRDYGKAIYDIYKDLIEHTEN